MPTNNWAMEIALIGYAIYASFMLIWCSCSPNDDAVECVSIPPSVLDEWSTGRTDLIIFDLHPDGSRQRTSVAGSDALAVTPSSLKDLTPWLPPRQQDCVLRSWHNSTIVKASSTPGWLRQNQWFSR